MERTILLGDGWHGEWGEQWDFAHAGVKLSRCTTALYVEDGVRLLPTGFRRHDEYTAELFYPRDLRVEQRVRSEAGWLHLETKVVNGGHEAVRLQGVHPLEECQVSSQVPLDRVVFHHDRMLGPMGLEPLNARKRSHGCLGLSGAAGEQALVVGFARLDDAFYWVTGTPQKDGLALSALCCREGIPLEAGEELNIAPLMVGAGRSLWGLLDEYARLVGQRMQARDSQAPKTGWCSWYYYYGQEEAKDVLRNVGDLANSPLKDRLQVIQIDDGWNLPHHGHARVWGDWFPGNKFPQGMKAVVDEIHGHGFAAGLWLAPFSVSPASKLAAAHPDWLVQDPATGAPVKAGTVHGLDLTHPEVLTFLEETFRRVFDQWGFDYVKLDFLMHSLVEGRRYDPTKTTAEAFRQGLAVIRKLAGERFILACGSPLGPAIGLADAMRIGADVGTRWLALTSQAGAHGNCDIKAPVVATLTRHWMHGNWWQNDPDCLVVRDWANPHELDFFRRVESRPVEAAEFGLSMEEAALWTRLVWMVGGVTMLSEDWVKLSGKRQQLVQSAFASNPARTGWVDWYVDPAVGILRTWEGPLYLGIFNFSDEPKTIQIPSVKLGLTQWTFAEILSQERFQGGGSVLSLPEQPARSGRIWRLVGGEREG